MIIKRLLISALTVAIAGITSLAMGSSALAYNGSACVNMAIKSNQTLFCNSGKPFTHVRRAVVRFDNGDWGSIKIQNSSYTLWKAGFCFTKNCTADTAYLTRDIDAIVSVHNSGPSTTVVNAWLYP